MTKEFITTKHQTQYLRKLIGELSRTVDVIEGLAESNLTAKKEIDNKDKAREIAKVAHAMYGWNLKPGGHCLKAVQDILDRCGLVVDRVPSAYMFVQAAMQSSDFMHLYRVVSQPKDFCYNTATEGTIIVYNKEDSHPHGHIEIKTFGTSWVSDYLQMERKRYGSQTLPWYVFEVK